MTVSAAYTPAVYTADGTANQFNFSFSALRTQDVWLVEHDKDTGVVVREFQGGSGLTVSLGSGFVIIDDYDQRPLAGNKVTVYRRTQATQTVDLDSTVPVSSDAVEGMSDKLTLLAQEAQNFSDDYTDLQQYAAQAEAAQLAAESARDDAVIAQGAAESARDLAISAKGDAENAQTAAEGARDTAVGAKNDAENARDAAAQSASDALVSEGNAANSAQAASDDADAAKQARDEIEALYIGTYANDGAANAAHPSRPAGALYFNSTSNNMRLWDGSAWQVVATPSGDFLPRNGTLPMTGVLQLVDGSAGAPALTFASDPDTGFYRVGPNNFGIATGGDVRLSVGNDKFDSLVPFRAGNGSAGAPAFSFRSAINTGMFLTSGVLGFATAGFSRLQISHAGVQAFVPFLPLGGSAATPSYAFSDDPDTGLYRVSANVLGLSAGGALAFSATAAGSSFSQGGVTTYTVTTTGLLPNPDNTRALGGGSNRWTTVYATSGTINTSDAREKTAVVPMTPTEVEAAKDIAREIGTFQWLESVEKKGDAARKHVGLTVQRAIQIMQSHGLDPFAYGFICYDEWDANEMQDAGDRYSFRTDQLNLFIARGLEARLTALEAALQ